ALLAGSKMSNREAPLSTAKPVGTTRSSRTSSMSRCRIGLRRVPAVRARMVRGLLFRGFQERSQEENDIVRSFLVGNGLRSQGKIIAMGAQAEGRGDARPVRLLLRGETHEPPIFSLIRKPKSPL